MKKVLKVFLLLAIFVISFLLMVISARLDSATTDESIHLFAGFTYLTQHDFRLDSEHPPLIKEIAVLPLLFLKPYYQLGNDWQKAGSFYYDSWKETREMSENFIYSWGNNTAQIIFLSRFMMILLTLALGFMVYFWAKKIYGEQAGIFVAFLTLLNPLILAHGRLVNTDIGVTLFIFISVYFWGKFLKKPNWLNLILSGIFIGLAFSSKYTAVILIPILIILAITKLILDKEKGNWWKYLIGLIGVKIIAFIVVWASYGFTMQIPPVTINGLANEINYWIGQPKDHNIFEIFSPKISFKLSNAFDGSFDHVRNYLFPANYYKGLILVLRHSISGHGAFLLGKNSNTGWWYYFPVAIFFKTPIALFIFLGLAIGFWKKIKAKILFDELLLILPPIIFLIFSMVSKADLGVRHILPIFPFLFVFLSKSINLINFKNFKLSKPNWATLIFIFAILWYFISSISSFPNYIAYFNEFAGSDKNGYKILTDSNLDWGQDIYRIKNYITENHLSNGKDQIYLVYPWDGEAALKYYGLDFPLLRPEKKNVKGKVIISATYYDTDAYAWLKKYPFKQITPGVFLVEIN